MTKRKWLIVVAIVIVAGTFVALRMNQDGQVQHFTAKVERGDIHDVVEATGMCLAIRSRPVRGIRRNIKC